MRETAFAKINLALHVRGRAADFYHDIETIFAFAEHGDTLSVSDGDGLSLEIGGPFAAALAGGDNLVLKAAYALQAETKARAGARLRLDKRLPVAAGIGGGSADAAAALRLLARWWGVDAAPADLMRIAASLGADVPACLESRPVRGDGRGDVLRPIDSGGIAGLWALLVNPGRPLATPAVFAGWDGIDRGPLEDWREGRNDLTAAAIRLVPETGAVLDALGDAEFARMSGSGATCFGLWSDRATRDAAAARIGERHADWWTLATRLRV